MMLVILVSLAALAGVFAGGLFLGRHLQERKVQRELKAILMGFQFGIVHQCPVCKQGVSQWDPTNHAGDRPSIH